MDRLHYLDGRLHLEGVDLRTVAAQYNTPCYVYSQAQLLANWQAFDQALGEHPHLICYAVKANSSLAILQQLARLGSGFDIVSGGELARVIRAGGDPAKVVFSGVGKRHDEMRAALTAGIRCFNVESSAELYRLNAVAGEMGLKAPIALRVNPDVDAGTHPYISTGLKENKFGVDIHEALALYQQAATLKHLHIKGLACHIGSQLTSLAPFLDALQRVLTLTQALAQAGITLQHLDLGGGLGIRYRHETPPSPHDYARALLAELAPLPYEILLEPGRAIVGNAGILLTRVEYLKPTAEKQFAIVDASMSELLRPALYDAWQEILPVVEHATPAKTLFDVVGPVCESADFLGKQRSLSLHEGDLLAICGAGAYGYCMSSNYNSRTRPAEVMISGVQSHLITRRETLDEMLARECLVDIQPTEEPMQRSPEPELMLDPQQAHAYASADFEAPHSYFIELFRQSFPGLEPSGAILDLGCGPGDIAVRFAKAFAQCEVDGIDGAQAMLEAGAPLVAASGLAQRVKLSYARLPEDAPPRPPYEGIISNSLLHHLHQPQILWEAIKRYAKPGAFVFVMDLMRPPSEAIARELVQRCSGNEPEVLQRDFYHSLLAAFRPDEIAQQLAQARLDLQIEVVSDRHLIAYGYLPSSH